MGQVTNHGDRPIPAGAVCASSSGTSSPLTGIRRQVQPSERRSLGAGTQRQVFNLIIDFAEELVSLSLRFSGFSFFAPPFLREAFNSECEWLASLSIPSPPPGRGAYKQGRLLGKMEALGFDLRAEANLRPYSSPRSPSMNSKLLKSRAIAVNNTGEWRSPRCRSTSLARSAQSNLARGGGIDRQLEHQILVKNS